MTNGGTQVVPSITGGPDTARRAPPPPAGGAKMSFQEKQGALKHPPPPPPTCLYRALPASRISSATCVLNTASWTSLSGGGPWS
jgi:hypothetical protein